MYAPAKPILMYSSCAAWENGQVGRACKGARDDPAEARQVCNRELSSCDPVPGGQPLVEHAVKAPRLISVARHAVEYLLRGHANKVVCLALHTWRAVKEEPWGG